jgi:tetratricopeptide (TPR) repeat protein
MRDRFGDGASMSGPKSVINLIHFQKIARNVKIFIFILGAFCAWAEDGQLPDARMAFALEHIQQGKLDSARKIFREIAASFSENADHLFHVGRLAAWLSEWEESERFLKKCLQMNRNHIDAAVQLGHVYLYNQRWNEAEEIFARYPDHMPAKAGLAKCALWRGDYPVAEECYRKILGDPAFEQEARLGLARSLAEQQKYREADSNYAVITQPEFQGTVLAPEKAAVASHTRIGALIDANYTQSVESDPNLHAPVAKIKGFVTSLSFFFPLTDQWRLDARGIFSHQKENNIYPPAQGINYDVLISEEAITARYYFRKDWRWDLYTRVLSGWKDGSMTFPFENKTLFEPGTTLLYNSARQIFTLDAFYDTLLIKNFAREISQFLLFSTIDTGYGYRFNVRWKPELEGRLAGSFFHDSPHNTQNRQDVWVRTGLPPWPTILTAIYHFEHAGFTNLSPNYYSYKNKWFQALGLRLYKDILSNGYFEIFYEHSWDLTMNLFEPIGTFLYVAARQYLIGNNVYGALGYSVDRCRMELSGHYFHNNLPYTDWNIKASFQWQF